MTDRHTFRVMPVGIARRCRAWAAALLCLAFCGCPSTSFTGEPFSMKEIETAGRDRANATAIECMRHPRFFAASDGTRIAYYRFAPVGKPRAVLLFLHGAGAWSAGGYQFFADGLARRHGIAVYLMDLRGHGQSGGPRGDAPGFDQVVNDVCGLAAAVTAEHPAVPFYLGGHSAGAGLALKCAAAPGLPAVRGYCFIAPYFGPNGGFSRHGMNDDPFARPIITTFALNYLTRGFFGSRTAVVFNYPPDIDHRLPGLVRAVSYNFIKSTTPDDPHALFAALDRPFCLLTGDADELFVPGRVMAFAANAPETVQRRSTSRVIGGAGHLSILLVMEDLLAEFMTSRVW